MAAHGRPPRGEASLGEGYGHCQRWIPQLPAGEAGNRCSRPHWGDVAVVADGDNAEHGCRKVPG